MPSAPGRALHRRTPPAKRPSSRGSARAPSRVNRSRNVVLTSADNITGHRPDPNYNFGRIDVLSALSNSACKTGMTKAGRIEPGSPAAPAGRAGGYSVGAGRGLSERGSLKVNVEPLPRCDGA